MPGDYREWSLAGWREHLRGVGDAQGNPGPGRLLAGYKCPKQVIQRASLPRNHVGKIVRGALC